MDFKELENKLKKIQDELNNDDSIKQISEQIKNNDFSDEQTRDEAKREYYSHLSHYEKIYQQKNDEYKELISGFSYAYLEMSDFYVGPELPRETFFDSTDSLNELYFMFLLSIFFIKK